jgi:hypothetical protein
MRLILALFAAAALTAPAAAQLPAPLEAALSVETRDLAPSSLDFRLEEDGEGVTVRVDLSNGAVRYTLLEPAEDSLSESQREMWDSFLDPEDDMFRQDEDDGEDGGGLTGPVDLRAVVGDTAVLDREEDGLLIYSFTPQSMPGGEDDDFGAMIENLSAEIAVDPARSEPAWLHIFALDSFKPHFAVRIHDLSVRQTFVHEPALEGPRMARMEMAFEASAAFQRMQQTMVMEISNMVFVEAGASSDLGGAAESP